MTKTAWQVFYRAWTERADVYHFHDPELMLLALLLRIRGAKVIFDVHEDIPYDISTKPWIPKRLRMPLSKLSELFLNVANRGYSAIIPATPAISRRLSHRRTVLVQNFPIVEESHNFQAQAYAQRPLTCIYVGSISRLRGIHEMVNAFETQQLATRARLIVVGDFEDSALEAEVRALRGSRQTDYLGYRSRAEVKTLLATARVGLLLFRPAPNHLESYPNKLFEYMAAGLPVIASDFPLWREIVEGSGGGIVVNPSKSGEVSDAITFLLDNPQTATAMGERGRTAATDRYAWRTEARKLNALYAALLG